MPTIKVRVIGKIAENLTPEVKIVCGNEDYQVEFEFDEPWQSANFKTGLFIYNGKLVAQPFDGAVCPMPIIENTTLLAIGVKTSDGELYTTTPAYADCLKSANDLATNKIPAPTKDVYDEIIALINKYIGQGGGGSGEGVDLRDYQKKVDNALETTDKTIVGAINEIFAKSSANGKEGVGISSIEQTVTSTEDKGKNVITVTLTNGEKSQFSVLNGSKGSQGEKGDKGEPGISPHIGDNGNWFIGNIDTGVSASGGGNVEFTSIDPSMIIFPNGVKTTYPIGKVELVNGIGELISIGGNLNEFFEKFIDETPPNTIQPSVSLTFSQAKGYEVGTKVTPSYSASFNKGSYTYDDDTGVSVSAWSVKDTNNKILTTATGSFPELTVSDGINYKITATATHSAGIVPKTNTGNPYADGQIKAGAKSATSGALTGYRNTFYGTLTAKTDPTSSIIRGLATKSGKALANGNSFTLNVPVGSLRVIFAYPETLRDVTSVKDVNGMNAEISSSFVKITVPVEGANGYTAISYKVYILDFAEANGTANKFTVTI